MSGIALRWHAPCAALVVAGLCAPWEVRAEAPRVVVTLAADARSAQLRTALAELLDRLGARADFAETPRVDVDAVLSQPPRPDLVARTWIDLSAGVARLFLVDAGGDRVFVRSFPLAHGLDEVARETLAHVVEDAIDALLHGAVIGVHRDTLRVPSPPPPSPPPASDSQAAQPPPTPSPRRWRVHLTTAGECQARGPMLAGGGALGAGMSWPLGDWRVGVTVTWGLRAATALTAAYFSVDTTEHAPRAMLTVSRAVGRRLSLWGEAGAGIDLIAAQGAPLAGVSGNAVDAPPWVQPVARVGVGVSVGLGSSFALVVGTSVEFDLRGTRYVVATADDGRAVALEPWLLRPGVTLGITAAL